MFSEAIKNCQTGSMIIKKQTTDVRILKTVEILITISKSANVGEWRKY